MLKLKLFFDTKMSIFSSDLPLARCTLTPCGAGRSEWMLLAYCLGAKITESLSFYNSHIVMLDLRPSKKKLIGKKYKVNVCGTRWLVDCLSQKRLQPVNSKMYDQDFYSIFLFKDKSFSLEEPNATLEELILYAQGSIVSSSASTFHISDHPEISMYNEKWVKLCIIYNCILDLPGTEYCVDDGEIVIPHTESATKKSSSTDVSITAYNLNNEHKGRDMDHAIDLLASRSLEQHSENRISAFMDEDSCLSVTPIQNTLMTPKSPGIFDTLAFVLCGFEVDTRRKYRSNILKMGGHCFALQELPRPWSNIKENQEYNMRVLLKFLKELKFNWIIIWSSKLPYLLSSKKFLLKSGDDNLVHVVNETWFTDAYSDYRADAQFELGKYDDIQYKPFKHVLPLVEFDNKVFTVTGYDIRYRLTIKQVIRILGGRFDDTFTNNVNYLIAPRPYDGNNEKIKACTKYNIPIATKEWLLRCVSMGKFVDIVPFLVKNEKLENITAEQENNNILQSMKLHVPDERYKEIALGLGASLTSIKDADYVVLEQLEKLGQAYKIEEFIDPKWLMTVQKLRKIIPFDHFIWKKKKSVIEQVIPLKRTLKEERKHDVSYE
eukprot:NODE_6_length_48303_cov_0.387022.p9 type:complete len:605 gc:universal NODE_6_length_48303_cov_0.387022:16317-14503(-)